MDKWHLYILNGIFISFRFVEIAAAGTAEMMKTLCVGKVYSCNNIFSC